MSNPALDARVINVIRIELDHKRMSASELARRIGMSQAKISRRLCGRVPFTITELEKIAHVLGISVEDLVAEPGQMRFSA